VDECIDAYCKLSKEIFRLDHVFAGVVPDGDDTCRFNYQTFEETIQKLIEEKLGDKNHVMSAKPIPPKTPSQCHTFVVATMAGDVRALPMLFRSYSVAGERQTQCPIWQAARATTAAPTYFKPILIGVPSVAYMDGGLGHNNPAHLALSEARRLWGQDAVVYLLSIGTGHQSATSVIDDSRLQSDLEIQRSLFKQMTTSLSDLGSRIPIWNRARNIPDGVLALLKMANALTKIATNSELVHDNILGMAEHQFPYFRFNVERDVGDIGLQDYKKQHALTTATIAYMKPRDMQKKKIECASMLMDPSSFFGK
jgi:patatin-like phospholipase/acyl hydrolase